MIAPVERAVQRAYIYYGVQFVILIVLSIFCFVMAKRKDSMVIFGVVLMVVAIVIFTTSFMPFFLDCSNSGILVDECVYINSIGNKSKTPSSIMGIYSVKLITDNGEIMVSTVPMSNSNFPVGEYLVRAYYTTNSKRLIFIEILE